MAVQEPDWQKLVICCNSWLERSGACPLSLKLKCYHGWDKLQNLLQPYAQKILSLTLDFLTKNGGPFMVEDFHALEELTINPYVAFPTNALDRSLSKLPVNLRRLNMNRMLFNREQFNFFSDSTWARLTHVGLTVNGLDAFTGLLRLCPNLTSLTITATLYLVEHVEPATHLNLQSLSMSWIALLGSSEDLFPFKDITLPNLRVLEATHDLQWEHEQFMEFLMRSKCSLERLAFNRAMGITAERREEYTAFIPCVELLP